LVVVVFVVAAFVWGHAAQSERGSLGGTIKDMTGAPLPGVTVEASGPMVATAVTDGRGTFRVNNLIPGDYTVTATLSGFSVTTTRARVVARGLARVSREMGVGSLAETVVVTGETPAVDVQRSTRQARRSDDKLAKAAAGAIATFAPATPQPLPPPSIRQEALRRANGRPNTEAYEHLDENGFKRVSSDPLSTFSVDVDTASYANVRRFLNEGRLPEPGAVRIEELVNYFRLPYAAPDGDEPFAITTELAACPWNPAHRLALIGIQGRQLPPREPAPRNLVFLLDVSGSMMPPDKLPLVQSAMRMLVDALSERDRVAIVVYAGASGLVLPSTPGTDKATIARAIADLRPGGSTNGAAGIQLAYRIAREHFIRGG